MTKLILTRDVPAVTSYGTTGVLRAMPSGGAPDWLTLEDPWNDNLKHVSCIPVGSYTIVRDNTGRHRYFRVLDVPGRTHIEIHPGNTIADTTGCICLGLQRSFVSSAWYLQQSKAALASFMDFMHGEDEAQLVIEWAVPKPWGVVA